MGRSLPLVAYGRVFILHDNVQVSLVASSRQSLSDYGNRSVRNSHRQKEAEY